MEKLRFFHLNSYKLQIHQDNNAICQTSPPGTVTALSRYQHMLALGLELLQLP